MTTQIEVDPGIEVNPGRATRPGPRQPADPDRALVDAFVAASRALVAVAARSLVDLEEDITLPQFRALVVLGTRGPQRIADLAERLQVNPSTASRMTERLVRKQLVTRARVKRDRRTLRVALTPAGKAVVGAVMDRRRADIESMLASLPKTGRRPLTIALRAFADAAGEAPDQDWALGWDQDVEPVDEVDAEDEV